MTFYDLDTAGLSAAQLKRRIARLTIEARVLERKARAAQKKAAAATQSYHRILLLKSKAVLDAAGRRVDPPVVANNRTKLTQEQRWALVQRYDAAGKDGGKYALSIGYSPRTLRRWRTELKQRSKK
jgi:hypothetical protein